MTIRLIQGFEQYETTSDPAVPYITADEVGRIFGFRDPANTANWFQDSGGLETGLSIDDSDARIDGRSLRFDRPDAAPNNLVFNGQKHVDLTYSFASATRACIGFSVKFDKQPDVPIPLVQGLYDNGVTEEEQFSVWLSPTGSIFFADSSFDVSVDGVQTPTALGSGLSSSGVFRWVRHIYVEVDVDYTTLTPTGRIYINGTQVVSVSSVSLQKTTATSLTGLSIINPNNLYFADDNFVQYVDDIYVTTGEAALTPQHIVMLAPSTVDTAEWTPNGGTAHSILSQLYDSSDLADYVYNTGVDEDVYNLTDAPADIVAITAVATTGLFSVDSGSSVLQLPIYESGTQLNNAVTIDDTLPQFAQGVFRTNANGAAWTNALVDSMKIGLDLN